MIGQAFSILSVAPTSASPDRARQATRLRRGVKQNSSIGFMCANHDALRRHLNAGDANGARAHARMSHLRHLPIINA